MASNEPKRLNHIRKQKQENLNQIDLNWVNTSERFKGYSRFKAELTIKQKNDLEIEDYRR